MKKIITLILILASFAGYSQTVGQFRYDTTKFLKVGGRNHVIIENLIGVGDSTNYKPLVVGPDGVIKRNSFWPSGAGGGSGTVTSFSSGNLSPLFTTSVATSTSTPALSFILTDAPANSFFGRATSGTGAPSYVNFSALDSLNNSLWHTQGYWDARYGGGGGGGVGTLQQVTTLGDTTSIGITIASDTLIHRSTDDSHTFIIEQPKYYADTFAGAVSGVRRQDRWYTGYATFPGVNADGRPNVVRFHGYNADPGGGRANLNDASFQFREEAHYQIGGNPSFEFHMPELTPTNGTDPKRLFSIYANKITGKAFSHNTVDAAEWYPYTNPLTNYASLSFGEPGGAGTGGAGQLYLNGNVNGVSAASANITLNMIGSNTFQMLNDGYTPTFRLTPAGGGAAYPWLRFEGMTKITHFNNLQLLSNGAALFANITDPFIEAAAVHASAKIEIRSTTQGFLPSRMTGAEAEAISAAEGLLIYSTDGSGSVILSKGWWGYDGAAWVKLN